MSLRTSRLSASERAVETTLTNSGAKASIRAADSRHPAAIVLEAIKLVEAGHAPWCDEIWLVVCEPDAQLARLTGRGMAESDARQRIDAQAVSLPLWRSAATRVLRTDGSPEETEKAVDAALRETLAGRD